MYLVFTRMPGESYRGRLRSLSYCLCYHFGGYSKTRCVKPHSLIQRRIRLEAQWFFSEAEKSVS